MEAPDTWLESLRVSPQVGEEYALILRLTGEVTAAWAAVESYLAGVLEALAGCSYNAAQVIYFSPSSFSGRLAVVRNLTNHEMLSGPEKRLLTRLFERLERLSKARNAFIHSSVFIEPSERKSVRRRIMHPAKAQLHSEYRATVNDLRQHLARMGPLYRLLHVILNGSQVDYVRRLESAAFNTAPTTSGAE